jgi:cytochrome P450
MQVVDAQSVEKPRSTAAAFEPYAPEFDADPYPQYRALRANDPLHWWDGAQAWVVSRYEDVASLLRDKRFSLRYTDWELAQPRQGGGPGTRAFIELLEHGVFTVDDATHTRLRKVVSPAFTPSAVERRRPAVQRIVDEALGNAKAGDRIDLAARFAERIPMRVIAELLGVPVTQEATFRSFGLAVSAAVSAPWISGDELEAVTAPVPAGIALVRTLIEERRGRPRDDLLSTLIHAEEEGERIDTAELLSLVAGLIIAGSETTVHAIAFGVLNLLRHPDQLRLLQDDPSLVRPAVDELLRYDLFGRLGSPRFAREDVVIHGKTVRKGQMIMLLVSSALRDERAFPDPDRLDLRRDNSGTVAFGIGPHYCLGASLARLQAEVAFATLFQRFPATVLDGELVYGSHLTLRRLASLPVRLG